jgi:peroxiredoxin (alkyl hydroperoxide reductase subunit C)
MSLTAKKAPEWKAQGVVNGEITEISSNKFDGKYKVLFFYPLDFTFVCPTELHAFQDKLEEFKKRDVEVIGVSVDSAYSHLAWVNTPRKKGGIQGVTYPIVADMNKQISKDFGVLLEDAGVALRGLFLIDKDNIVQHSVVNNLSLGRNVDEVIRMVDALKFNEEHGEVCPANWKPGEKSMVATQEGLATYFK